MATAASPPTTPTARPGTSPAPLLGAAAIGAAVAVALGVYGREHAPTGEKLFTLGFSATINMKAWVTTGVLVLAVVQIVLALRLYGKLGRTRAPAWVGPAHRIVGLAAFVLSLPVAYHCLWALGFESDGDQTRRFAHSLLGCAFYGAFVLKVLAVRSRRMPRQTLPVLGGLVFAVLVAVWFTSSLWFFGDAGFPSF